MKNKINVLLVCGYGVGSSLMLKTIVNNEMKKRKINAELKHIAAGEVSGYSDWVDVIVVSKKLSDIVSLNDDKALVEVVNLMDGATIGNEIEKIVRSKFPDAIDG